ncbi:MAG: sulfurtransferase [Gemmatimonadales bacterium]|nr:sulfurtransferase [Gemmatimonadales bacterium]
MRPGLLSTDALARQLDRVRVLDASWYLPAMARDARAEFVAGHLPGARFFDLDAASDPASDLPHMLPTAAHFERTVRALGVRDGDRIVVYDGSGANLSAARAWWMFRAFGHEDVHVLDGGLGRWRVEGRALESGEPAPTAGDFVARPRDGMVVDLADLRAALRDPSVQVVDLRSTERFEGRAPEPRAGVRGGHMPGSRSLPYATLVDADGRVLDDVALRRRLAEAGVRAAAPVIATCGSGVSACALVLALHALGQDGARVYDGSWTEWGGRDDTPVALGPA